MDPSWVEATVNASQVKVRIKEAGGGLRFLEAKSWLLFLLLAGQLAALWYLRIHDAALVSETTLTVLVPICLVLIVVAFLMPSLRKFSGAGIAIELAQGPTQAEPKGPKGKMPGETPPTAGPTL